MKYKLLTQQVIDKTVTRAVKTCLNYRPGFTPCLLPHHLSTYYVWEEQQLLKEISKVMRNHRKVLKEILTRQKHAPTYFLKEEVIYSTGHRGSIEEAPSRLVYEYDYVRPISPLRQGI